MSEMTEMSEELRNEIIERASKTYKPIPEKNRRIIYHIIEGDKDYYMIRTFPEPDVEFIDYLKNEFMREHPSIYPSPGFVMRTDSNTDQVVNYINTAHAFWINANLRFKEDIITFHDTNPYPDEQVREVKQ